MARDTAELTPSAPMTMRLRVFDRLAPVLGRHGGVVGAAATSLTNTSS